MQLINVRIQTNDSLAQPLSEFLMEQGALSTSLHASDHEEIFTEDLDKTPLWKNTTVCALFKKESYQPEWLQQFEHAFRLNTPLSASIENIPDKDWVSEIQNQFPAQCYQDSLWVCPDWDDTPHPGKTTIQLSPGLAFGTGTHATTQMCLDWLASTPLEDKTVMDYGCGSGILAIGALALGAKEVWATDHDPQAMQATTNNLSLNPNLHQEQFHLFPAPQPPTQPVDIVIANILATPLIRLEPTLRHLIKKNGTLVLSGLLNIDIKAITETYATHFTLQQIEHKEEWVCITWIRNKD